ncbi:MAG: hypothetical protein OEY10_08420, partial [Nitrosopumilus sp.]|nr:hypothetical protein [Nitrosopumilus sp.]
IFPGVDINGLSIDPGGNEIYLAAASDAQELKTPALLRRITLLGGKLTNDYVDVDIDSYAATDVDVAGNHIYITSGADYGKITVLNKNDLSLHYQFDANDARSVDVDAQDVTVFAGTPATLYTFDRNSGELVDQFTYTGASIVNSKSTVETKQAKAFIGAGDGGTHIVCIATGELLANIPQAIIPDLDPLLSVTNSVTVYKRAVFMGNGEAGVYLALASENFNANNCIVNDLQLAGKLQLPDAPSINHIVYRHDLLFVASGLGGLKIISVNIANSTDDNDDT